MRIDANNASRVRSAEDIADGRRARIEFIPNPYSNTDIVIVEMDARTARALARTLTRHASFIDPRPRRKK